MAKEVIAYSIEADSAKAGKSLSDLKKEFKESQSELSNLVQGTKEYYDQLKKVASVKDEMGDLRDTIESFKPDQKLKALGNAVTLVGHGFAAAQGAMALFGGESKELEQALLKVQTAMAFSQAIQGLQNFGDTLSMVQSSLMKTAIGTKIVTAAQWLWNAAMAANPIGLIIAGIAALVSGIALLVDAQDDEAEALKHLNELREKSIEAREREIDLIKKKQGIIQEGGKFELDMAKALGKSDDELYDLERKNIQKRIDDLKLLKWYRVDGKLNYDELEELNKLNRQLAILEVKHKTDAHNAFVKLRGEEKEAYLKDIAEKEAADLEAYDKQADIWNKEAEAYDAKLKKQKEARLKSQVETELEARQLAGEMQAAEDEITKIKNEESFLGQQENLRLEMEAELLLVEDNESKKELIKQEYANKHSKLKQEQFNQEVEGYQQLAAATQVITDMLFTHQLKQAQGNAAKERSIRKKQFQVNKAFGVANSIIDGVQAVQKALNNPYPLNIILAVASGLMATANTVKIANTKFNDGGGAATGGGDLGGNIQAPSIAPPTQGSTQLNSDGTVKSQTQSQPTIKAYVTETDITKTQKKVNTIEQSAKL